MIRLTARRVVCAALAASLWSGADLRAQDDPAAAPQAPATLLADEPQSPQEQFGAILLMLRLDRADLAKGYLVQFLAGEPDDVTLLGLRDTHGTSTFLRLSRIPELLPESQQLMQRLQTAAAGTLDDPAYFDALLNQLEGDPREREAAITAIRQFGGEAVPGLMSRLGQGDRAGQHDLLLYTLVKLGAPAVPPVLAALESPSERVRALAVEALGWLGSEELVPHLWSAAFGKAEPPIVQQSARRAIARIRHGSPERTDLVTFDGVVDEVRDLALRHFAGEWDWMPDDDGQVAVWSWSTEVGGLVKTMTSPARASAFLAQRLAHQALSMTPERRDVSELFLAASLAEAGFRAGWDQPWPVGPGTAHNLAMFSGAELTAGALGLAVTHRNAAAAVGALKALGQVGHAQLLVDTQERQSPLIAALDYPHDRVQFAAASCVLQIDPIDRFARSHRVVEILARALSDAGGAASVVIDPNAQRASSIAALLRAIGYETSIVGTGREGFQTAAERGDVTLAVLHPNTIRWELTQTMANFRADARTAGIPLAIYGPQPLEADLRRLVERTQSSKFIVTGGNSADWQRQLASLVAAVEVPPLTPEQRSQRIAAAAYWLRHIAEGRRSELYDLAAAEEALAAAVQNPEIAADALLALATIPGPSVQQQLAETVTAPAQAIELRELAGWQLSRHMRRFGDLLTSASMNELKTVWQETDDPRVRTALTSVLGTGGSSAAAIRAALESHGLSPQP